MILIIAYDRLMNVNTDGMGSEYAYSVAGEFLPIQIVPFHGYNVLSQAI